MATQLMIGVSLAACAGLRAWLPLLMVGLLAHFHYVTLGSSYAFLANDNALIIFGIATVVEVVADKILGLDHLMDTIGTVIRPAAGTILSSAMLTHVDPTTATVLGLIVGGTTSLTIHAGKAAARIKTTALSPLHAGAGNATVSTFEDALAVAGPWAAIHYPAATFAVTVMLLIVAGFMVYHLFKTGKKVSHFFKNRGRSSLGI
ncbi:MAG: DUF4126 domain-containing protein [Armatimonadota bacterium]|nr:DUF4126 domain-containing protein [Armatimonadota bacterium]